MTTTRVLPAIEDDWQDLSRLTKQRNVVKNSVREQTGQECVVALRRGDECILIGVDAFAVSRILDRSSFREIELHTEGDQLYVTVVAIVHETLTANLLNAVAETGMATAVADGTRFRVASQA